MRVEDLAMAKAKGQPKPERRARTTVVMDESLLVRLKVAAAEELRDVSAVLADAAETYLRSPEHGSRRMLRGTQQELAAHRQRKGGRR